MSIKLIEDEVKRFLRDEKPEVLCLKGRWGVGKTFAWRKWLAEVQADASLSAKRYAYVSLFGLNSLDGLRYSIFENTVTPENLISGPNVSTLNAFVRKGFDLGRKSRSLLDPIMALAGAKDGGEALFRSAFMLVKDQLVCLDDLERAGEGLRQRDVLGLASALKEQRNCKVVLLLNDEAMKDDEKEEFERQLEKVVDIPLVFDPNPSEAAAIALSGSTDLEQMLREHTVQLGILNIRVIKKIERMAQRLQSILKDFPAPILKQAVAAVVLGGWAEFQPNEAPPFDTLISYNRMIASMKKADQDASEAMPPWVDRLENYPFMFADELDMAVFDGVRKGFFNEAEVDSAAQVLRARLEQDANDSSFNRAWQQYWHNLTVDDDTLLNDIFNGAMENLKVVSPVNISATAQLLRKSGREAQADQLVDAYVDARDDSKGFFDLHAHHFMSDDTPDPRLAEKFAQRHEEFVDDRDPQAVLIEISERQSWNDEDVKLIADLTRDQLVALFLGIEGPDLRRSIKFAHLLSRQHSDDAERLKTTLGEAMQVIAARSAHSKRRLQSWGVPV
jgi:hypothetical protein